MFNILNMLYYSFCPASRSLFICKQICDTDCLKSLIFLIPLDSMFSHTVVNNIACNEH